MPVAVELQEAEEFRRSLIRYELEMLKAFGFITHVEHPHKLLLNYCQILGLGQPQVGAEQQDPVCPEFLQEAWNVANDRYATLSRPDFRPFLRLDPVRGSSADSSSSPTVWLHCMKEVPWRYAWTH